MKYPTKFGQNLYKFVLIWAIISSAVNILIEPNFSQGKWELCLKNITVYLNQICTCTYSCTYNNVVTYVVYLIYISLTIFILQRTPHLVTDHCAWPKARSFWRWLLDVQCAPLLRSACNWSNLYSKPNNATCIYVFIVYTPLRWCL